MSRPDNWSDEQFAVRIPADVDREDRLLADLTARQVAILATAGVVLWLAFTATRHLVPPAVFAGAAAPFALAAVVLALGRRDGLSMDRLAAAAVRRPGRARSLRPDGSRSLWSLVVAPARMMPADLY